MIDLGMGFFTIKLSKEESQKRALQEGLWFIETPFLTVRSWEPDFVPSETRIQTTTIWLKLPHLQTKYYDLTILEKAGRKIGKLVKIDICTSFTLRKDMP